MTFTNSRIPPSGARYPSTKCRAVWDCEYVEVDPEKIFVVETEETVKVALCSARRCDCPYRQQRAEFLWRDEGWTHPATLPPHPVRRGNIANAVLGSMGTILNIPRFEVYTEVIQDAVIDMMQKETSPCQRLLAYVSNEVLVKFSTTSLFKNKLVLRPSEISNTRTGTSPGHHRPQHRHRSGYLRQRQLHPCERYQDDERYRGVGRFHPQLLPLHLPHPLHSQERCHQLHRTQGDT